MGRLIPPPPWELHDEPKQPAEPSHPAPAARFHTEVRGPFVLIAPNNWVRASSVVAVKSWEDDDGPVCQLTIAGLGISSTDRSRGEYYSRVPLVDMLKALMVASIPEGRG